MAPSDKVSSVLRPAMLIGSILISLCSGTNYIYSAYAPQLGACLQISHTQLNIIGLAGNSSYISGPVCGRMADLNGSKILLATASICLLVGYLGIRQVYDNCIVDGRAASTLRFGLLVVCSFMTGVGGCAAYSAAINATAKSFPSSSRATTTALVVSGPGLSAFLFTLLANILFPGDVSALLLTLAIGTATPILICLPVINPVPLPSTSLNAQNVSEIDSYDAIPREDVVITGGPWATLNPEVDREANADSTPLLSPEQESTQTTPEGEPLESLYPKATIEDMEILPDIHGIRLWLTPDFYLIFCIMAICTGTALMYINNVGSISHALYVKTHPVYDEIEISEWQAAQVSILSLGSFASRIAIGLICDFTYARFHLPRAYCFCIASSLFIISQAAAIAISSVESLWVATLLVGLAYGSFCGSYTSVMIEWFGLAHVSENLGYILFSPVVGGNIFSLMFGYNMDNHKPSRLLLMRDWSLTTLIPRNHPPVHQCLDGKACYVESLQVTLVACIVVLGLSWWAGIRDGEKMRSRNVIVGE